MKEVKKQRKKSTQALLGLQTFGKYGLKTEKGEAMCFTVYSQQIYRYCQMRI